MTDNSLIEGLRDAVRHAQGDNAERVVSIVRVECPVDVKAVRMRMGLSQTEFADRFGFVLATLRNWEQGRRQPSGVNRNFLKVIEKLPNEVQKVLTA